MAELLVLLVPLAVAYGWYMGRRSVALERRRRELKNSESYVAGLNYLLADQSDKAVDLFIQAIEVDRHTIDTHFAVATLFRRKGELERAIRLHTNLLARPSLPQEFRELAALELAEDYLSAGVVDRAEQLLLELLANDAHRAKAGARLLSICEQSHDWQRSLQLARQFRLQREAELLPTIFHHQCQLAEQALIAGQLPECSELLIPAGRLLPEHPRLFVLRAQLARQLQQDAEEQQALERAVQLQPLLALELLPRLVELAGGAAAPQLTALLARLDLHAAISLALAQAAVLQQQQGALVAREYLLTLLRQRPNLRAFRLLTDLYGADSGDADSWQQIGELLDGYLAASNPYQCQGCGYQSRNLLWQCPACQRWDSVSVKRGLDGE